MAPGAYALTVIPCLPNSAADNNGLYPMSPKKYDLLHLPVLCVSPLMAHFDEL